MARFDQAWMDMLKNTNYKFYNSGLSTQRQQIGLAKQKLINNAQNNIINEVEINQLLKDLWYLLNQDSKDKLFQILDSSFDNSKYTDQDIENFAKNISNNLYNLAYNQQLLNKIIFNAKVKGINVKNLTNQLQNIIKQTSNNVSNIKGDFGELLIAFLSSMTSTSIYNIEKDLDESFKLTGKEKTKNRFLNIDTNFIGRKTKRDSRSNDQKEMHEVLYGIQINKTNTSIKADIESDVFNGLSGKTTKYNDIKLQENGNLLTYFFTAFGNQNNNITFFTNEFTLGYTRAHVANKSKIINSFNDLLKESVFLQALTGYQQTYYNKGVSNLIILQPGNNNNPPIIKIFNVGDLLNKIKHNKDLIKIQYKSEIPWSPNYIQGSYSASVLKYFVETLVITSDININDLKT